jgi:hypothetical protein
MRNYILMFFLLTSCQSAPFKIYVNNNYNGPCIVFTHSRKAPHESIKKIKINDGLGITFRNSLEGEIRFYSDDGKELKIIQIGQEEYCKESSRYIFQLVRGTTDTRCTNKSLEILQFFVGKKSDFLKWTARYNDIFEFFDSAGIKWCEYYLDKSSF